MKKSHKIKYNVFFYIIANSDWLMINYCFQEILVQTSSLPIFYIFVYQNFAFTNEPCLC